MTRDQDTPPPDWATATEWAKHRFQNMMNPPGADTPRLQSQAEQDRALYPAYFTEQGSRLLMMVRFMVEACGIPYEQAERQAISDFAHRQKHGHAWLYDPDFPEDGEPADVAAQLVAGMEDIVEAIHFARIANQARKGTEGAAFWNNVVRELRTGQFSPLQTTQEAYRLDEADYAKRMKRPPRPEASSTGEE